MYVNTTVNVYVMKITSFPCTNLLMVEFSLFIASNAIWAARVLYPFVKFRLGKDWTNTLFYTTYLEMNVKVIDKDTPSTSFQDIKFALIVNKPQVNYSMPCDPTPQICSLHIKLPYYATYFVHLDKR